MSGEVNRSEITGSGKTTIISLVFRSVFHVKCHSQQVSRFNRFVHYKQRLLDCISNDVLPTGQQKTGWRKSNDLTLVLSNPETCGTGTLIWLRKQRKIPRTENPKNQWYSDQAFTDIRQKLSQGTSVLDRRSWRPTEAVGR
ncbi:UNVERIFIED_CONTAM: hypothetical protein NCL1_53782 [Trichonephila clavipes]